MPEVLSDEQVAALAANASTPVTTAEAKDTAPDPLAVLRTDPSIPREFVTTTGIKLTLSKPINVAFTIARALGTDAANQSMFIYFRALAWIRTLNGHKVPLLATKEDFESMATMLGDDALDELVNEVFAERVMEAVNKDALKKLSTAPTGGT